MNQIARGGYSPTPPELTNTCLYHGDEVQLVQVEQADAVLVVGVFDGLPQRGILLVHGVRARRGGVAREGEGAQFDSDPQERGSDCKFGCRAIA